MLDTSARLLRLLSILQSRPEWTGAELADRLGVTLRTLRRDVARIRDLGYSVQATPGVAGGYRLGIGTALPPLMLDDDEAVAVVLGLRMATGQAGTDLAEPSTRALVKMERLLPEKLRHRIAALRDATTALAGPGDEIAPSILTLLAEACKVRHRVVFAYVSGQGQSTDRRVEPHRLVLVGRRWYLVARDPDREGWRTFRVDRISRPRSTGQRFEHMDPPDAARLVARAITVAPYPHRVRILVLAPADVVAQHFPPTVGIIEVVDEGRCELFIGTDSLTRIAGHLAALGRDFVVVEPPALIEELAVVARRLLEACSASERYRDG